MTFNPFNLFKGNPKVIEMMAKKQPLDVLLMQQPFISEFRRSENETLNSYMSYEKYGQLIEYITVIDEKRAADKNRSFRYPFVSAQILSINNELTQKYLLTDSTFTEQQITEQIQVQKQVDSESSDRSYSSIRSSNSNSQKLDKLEAKQFEQEDKENFVIRGNQDANLQDFLNEDKQINEDDFPDAKTRKTVFVKEKVSRTIKKPFQPLIFKLLRYFQKSVVHILDGYVCKVLETIIANCFEDFVSIIEKYDGFNSLKGLYRHIDSSSVQEWLLNFIAKMIDHQGTVSFENQSSLLDMIQDECAKRVQEWSQSSLTVQDRVYYLELYALVVGKFHSRICSKQSDGKQGEVTIRKQLMFLSSILKNKHIQDLTSVLNGVLIVNLKVNVNIVLGLLKVLRNILDSITYLKGVRNSSKIVKEDLTQTQQIVQKCQDSFDHLINLGYNFIFQDMLLLDPNELADYKPVNSLRLKMQFLDIMGKMTLQDIYFSRKTIIDSAFYDHLFKLLDLYPNSSIFHNSLLKIITPFIALKHNDIATINKFFQKQKLLSFIHRAVIEDYAKRYESKKKIRKCYIGHIIKICEAIQKFDCQDSQDLLKYKQTEQWQYIQECLLEEQQGIRKKLLGGHQRIHQKKPLIFFSKKDSLNHFRYFLTGMKYNMFQQFQNYEPSNSDSEDEVERENKYREEDRVKQQFLPGDQKKYFEQNID